MSFPNRSSNPLAILILSLFALFASTAEAVVVTTAPQVTVVDSDRSGAETVQLSGSITLESGEGFATSLWLLNGMPAGLGNDVTLVDLPIGEHAVELQVDSFASGTQAPLDHQIRSVTVIVEAADPLALQIQFAPGTPVRGDTVNLSASGDPGVSYFWSDLQRPAGSSALLSPLTGSSSAFVADQAGNYRVELNGTLGVSIGTVFESINVAAIAPSIAAAPSNPETGEQITLSASAAAPNASFGWQLTTRPSGSAASLSSASGAGTTFEPDVAGQYVIELTATNGAASESTSRTISVSAANRPPVAGFTLPASATTGGEVEASSTATDPDGDPLTIGWELIARPAGSSATLSTSAGEVTRFTPDLPGNYSIRQGVSDPANAGDNLTQTISVEATNRAPVAGFTLPASATTGSEVEASSTATDPDGDPLTISWELIARPAGSSATLSSTSGNVTRLTPDLPGNYSIRQGVSDSANAGDNLTQTISVEATNRAPVAGFTLPASATIGSEVEASSTATDPDGDPLNISWELIARPAGSSATLSTSAGEVTRFTPDLAGSYQLEQRVADPSEASSSVVRTVEVEANDFTLTITVDPSAPEVDQTVTLSANATLTGVSFSWSLLSRPAGSSATLLPSSGATSSFVGDVAGNYLLQLSGELDSLERSITRLIQVSPGSGGPPVADFDLTPANATVQQTVQLVDRSFDPDGGALSISWSLTSPPGSSATLSSTSGSSSSFVPDRPGNYQIRQQVTDPQGQSASSSRTLTVANRAPVAGFSFSPANPQASQPITLVSSGSDPDGNLAPHLGSWSVTRDGTPITVVGAGTGVRFIAAIAGNYQVTHRVVDSAGASDEVTQTVSVAPLTSAIVANAGAPQSGLIGSAVRLDGSRSSAADGRALIFAWSLIESPGEEAPTLNNADRAVATFTPELPGRYLAELRVSDDQGNSALDQIEISVRGGQIAGTAEADAAPNRANLEVTINGSVNQLRQRQLAGEEINQRQQNFLREQQAIFNLLDSVDPAERELGAEILTEMVEALTVDEQPAAQSQTTSDFASTLSGNLQQRFQTLLAQRNSGKTLLAMNQRFDLTGFNLTIDGQVVPGQVINEMLKAAIGGAAGDDGIDPTFGRWGIFLNGSLSSGDKEGSGSEESYEFDTQGITLGLDYRLSEDAVVGVAFTYSDSDTEFATPGSGIEATGYNLALYATRYLDNLYLDGYLGYGWSEIDGTRRVNFRDPLNPSSLIDKTLTSTTDSRQLTLGVGAGYSFNKGGLTLAPEAKLTYVSTEIDGYEEQSTQADDPHTAVIGDQESEALTLRLGGRANYAISTSVGVFVPQLRVNWVHELEDQLGEVEAALTVDPNNHYTVETDDIDTDYLELGVGVSGVFPNGISGFVDYQRVEGQERYSNEEWRFGVRYELQF